MSSNINKVYISLANTETV